MALKIDAGHPAQAPSIWHSLTLMFHTNARFYWEGTVVLSLLLRGNSSFQKCKWGVLFSRFHDNLDYTLTDAQPLNLCLGQLSLSRPAEKVNSSEQQTQGLRTESERKRGVGKDTSKKLIRRQEEAKPRRIWSDSQNRIVSVQREKHQYAAQRNVLCDCSGSCAGTHAQCRRSRDTRGARSSTHGWDSTHRWVGHDWTQTAVSNLDALFHFICKHSFFW